MYRAMPSGCDPHAVDEVCRPHRLHSAALTASVEDVTGEDGVVDHSQGHSLTSSPIENVVAAMIPESVYVPEKLGVVARSMVDAEIAKGLDGLFTCAQVRRRAIWAHACGRI